MHLSRSSSKLLLITVLALSASASAQTSKPSAVHSSTAQKPHVFVSAMTRPGAHVTGPLEYQYRFDRALEKEVAKKYALVPYDTCLLYTSDAADDLLCVDLGGRRIIKKK